MSQTLTPQEALTRILLSPKSSINESTEDEVRQRLNLITDAFPAAVAYVDEGGCYQFVNKTYEKWIGRKRADIIGQFPSDVLDAKTFYHAKPFIERALQGFAGSFEMLYETPTSGTLTVSVTYQPGRTTSDEIQGYVVVVRDISEEKRVSCLIQNKELLLLEHKRRFESVANATGLGVWYVDFPNSTAVCSPVMRHQLWFEDGEVVNFESFLSRVHPEDIELVRDRVRASTERLQPYDVTYRVQNPKNRKEIRWIHAMGWTDSDDSGRASRFDGFTVDVTEQKSQDNAILTSEKRFRALADVAPVPIWTLDQDEKNEWFNRAWLNYTGRTIEEEISKDWRDNVHPEDYDRCARLYAEALKKGLDFEIELRILRKDGRYRWFLNHGVARFSDEKEFIGYIGTCIDIHDQRNSEIHLREAVRNRDEFLSIVSHELRTPLTSMRLRNQMAQRELTRDCSSSDARRPEKIRKLFDQTERSVDRLTRLVDDMLDVSRISTGRLTIRKETFDIVEMIRELAERMNALINQARCTLKIHSAGFEKVCGEWDRYRIEQVFVNLMTNAIKYGAGKPIEVFLQSDGQYVDIHVRDHGRGIATQDHERIFQRFERAISAHEVSGLGLGLYIVRHILSLHGGAIHVESELGLGADFIVRLPL